MYTNQILGYLLAIVMGFTLGIFGGGGSILSVPIFVYVLGISPVLSTAYSLFVVGSAALVGSVKKHLANEIDFKLGILFAIPSILAVFITRRYLVPLLPSEIISIGYYILTKDVAIMIFFSLVMLVAARSMIRGRQKLKSSKSSSLSVIAQAIFVGHIAGLVGAGGGFLIVPALVVMIGLPINRAIGTSLAIIASQSLIGFIGDLGSGQAIDWKFLLLFSAFAISGMLVGLYTSKYINAAKLKKSFGWFVLTMAGFILVLEIFIKN